MTEPSVYFPLNISVRSAPSLFILWLGSLSMLLRPVRGPLLVIHVSWWQWILSLLAFLCLSSFHLSPLFTDALSVLLQFSIQLQTVPDFGSFYTIDNYMAVQRSSYCRFLKVKWIASVSVCQSLQELNLVGILCRRWCLVQLLSVLVWF